MKKQSRARTRWIAGAALFALVGISTQASAQAPPQQQPSAEPPAQTQFNQADQMLGPLNLTPEQVQRIRMINAELKDERQAAGQRLRMAHRTLTEAIESPNPNEEEIEKRSKDFADAQANAIRLRSLTQARVLQVLTPEQRFKLRELQQNQARIRQRNQNQRPGGDQRLPRALERQQNGVQRNTNRPLTPRQQRRITRPLPRP